MASRDAILNEIRRLAQEGGGIVPGRRKFSAETGILESVWWGKYWSKWSDAVTEAGLEPGKVSTKKSTDFVLETYADICRHYGKLPSASEVRLYLSQRSGLISHNAMLNHFGSKSVLDQEFASYVRSTASAQDLLLIIKDERSAKHVDRQEQHISKKQDGYVYLLKSGRHYKIGKSDDIERRIKSIMVSLPEKAELVHAIRTDDPSGIESYWHRRFAEKRANGEWFALSVSDVAAFRKRKYQ